MDGMAPVQRGQIKRGERRRGTAHTRGTRRSPAYWSLLGQLGLLGVALVFSLASGSKGDRAEAGHCPEGEVCSPDTPSGLYFRGPGFADSFLNFDVHVTAVGGRQTVSVSPAGFGEHLGDFDAESTEPVFTLSDISPPRVTLVADSVGSSYLRIFEPLTGALYDRLSISSQDIDSIEVAPIVFETELEGDIGEPIYWGGDPLPWIARLYHGGVRLVDEDLVFGATGTIDASTTTTGTWDLAEVTASPGANTITVAVSSGSGVTGLGEADMVFSVDTLTDDPTDPVPSTHDASDVLAVCFAAYSGNRRILGIPWEYDMTGPGGEEPIQADPNSYAQNCSQIRVASTGLWTLDVTAGDVTESYDIEMLPPAPPPPRPTTTPAEASNPQSRATRGTPGFRALRHIIPTSYRR